MYKLSKIYPGGKQVIKDISLSFLPGAKIGVLGGNGETRVKVRLLIGYQTKLI
jgi:ATPase subunit of ABC transporter with duplicated ATPase domains